MTVPFVHLHNHTEYSLLDGAQPIGALVRRAKELGMDAVAMTDHGNLFGAVKFYQAAKKEGVRPILGCEVYVAPGSRFDRSGAPGGRSKPYWHLVLLAENDTGFRNLVRLASYAYLEGFYYKPRVDKELLREYREGLIALSACLAGEVPSRILQGDMAGARQAALEYREIFGEGNFFLELQDHGIPGQERVGEGLRAIAQETGIPLVVTNDCHFLTREDHVAHDVLICIGTGRKRDERGRMHYTPEHYFKSGEEMLARFPDLREAVERTAEIAARCEVELELGRHHVPEFPVPEGETLESVFRQKVREGFEERRPTWERMAREGTLRHSLDEYEARLEREIETIVQMGFPGYFLIVWDFIRHAREQGIPVGPGRGSAAGSLVAYCLRITDIDPLQYDLLFERFLNPERVTMPDIDIDFCYRRRGEVIEYVTRKYGRENVAQIITFGTMAARAVVRDAGRVLDFPYAEVDRIAKLVPGEPGARLEDAIRDVPRLKEMWEKDPRVRELLEIALRLEGLSRHASTHAAGVVITPRPVIEYAPLFKSTRDEITTQWAKDEVEAIGLLKMDFLGLKTLTLIADTLDSIARSGEEPPDLDRVPLDDAPTYELFARGDTSGLFQFESSGMREILRRMKPERFEDLVALNALYRPGPLGSGMIDDFIERRHGRVEVSYPHPTLEPILRETYGVIVYQEQVMQIASTMAGYSLGEADLLRRAMGKKKKEVMEAERERFLSRAVERGIAKEDAARVFDLMAHFAGYGFNKSHSAAYALVAYRTAYLKAHWPRHFMAALLTSEKDHTDKLVEYIAECRARDIEILPPDVNRSGRFFEVEEEGIRFGLAAIKGVGEGSVDAILEARERVGRFRHLDDLCREVDRRAMNRKVLEALVKSGALDSLGDRARLFAAIDGALERGARHAEDLAVGQGALFGDATEAFQPPPLPEVSPWSDRERLEGEKEALGFYLSGHPLEEHADRLADVTTHRVADLSGGGEVVVGGLVGSVKRKRTKAGDLMAVFHLEDTTGQVECLVWPRTFREIDHLLEEGRAVVVRGRAEVSGSDVRLLVEGIQPLEDAPTIFARGLTVRIEADRVGSARLARLAEILREHPGPVPVFFEVVRPGTFRAILQADEARGVRADRELVRILERELGPGAARLGRPA